MGSHSTELAKLKRVVRYLQCERQWRQVFKHERRSTFTDSDWAGCKETRKSSRAGEVMLGDHTVKAYMRKQKIIARSSAEAELSEAALGAPESKGIGSLLRDLGCKKKPVLAIDAKATEHIFHRKGNREAEAYRCGILVSARRGQISETASAQSQERRKRGRLGNERAEATSRNRQRQQAGPVIQRIVYGSHENPM